MSIKNFGQMLIIIGVFLIFVMLFFTDWSSNLSFMQNIRYSNLICTEKYSYDLSCKSAGLVITLGQGLIFPLFLIALGTMVIQGIISKNILRKCIPFLDENESDTKR